MINSVNCWLWQSCKTRFALALLPFATVSAVLTATAHSVQADQIRFCRNYGVVRDRSDHEVPLLPRRSIAYCARSYQTLYQTYRVIPVSPDSRVSNSNTAPHATAPHATNAPIENLTPAPSDRTAPPSLAPRRSDSSTAR